MSTDYGQTFEVDNRILGAVYTANGVAFSLGTLGEIKLEVNFEGLLQYSTDAGATWNTYNEGVVGRMQTLVYNEDLTSFIAVTLHNGIYVSS